MSEATHDGRAAPPLAELRLTPLGKVAAPPDKESTSEVFYFWVEHGLLVERTQIVHTECVLAGRAVTFVGLVEEVYRQSRQRDMGEEVDRHDGRTSVRPPFESAGFTYAKAVILRTDPVTHAPPLEESTVYLGGPHEAAKGYGMDRMGRPLAVGLLRNGGTAFAGPARIDLDYLLGKNGGHLNVNGIAGLGAKSSFLLHVNYLLLRAAADERRRFPGKPDRFQVVPIVFNVKNYDLFYIDRWNREWSDDRLADWQPLGVERPEPFRDVRFFAPQERGSANPVNVGRPDTKVAPYSWALADVIQYGLFRYLFSDDDIFDPNFGGLVGEMEERLTADTRDGPRLSEAEGMPRTFQELLDWCRDYQGGDFAQATRGKLVRRLKHLIQDGDGVLRRSERRGHPLLMPDAETDGPLVIDLYALSGTPALQRFVVAAVFHQLTEKRSGNIVEGLRYLITLDELNRFAPRDGRDPITQKINLVAGEMRSQGIILLGAQQQASLVSPRVIENSAVRAVGRSGAQELTADVWKFLSAADRSLATQILQDEKLLIQPSFRKPMLAKIPFPPWALNKEDAGRRVDEPAVSGGLPAARKPRFEADFA